MNMEFNTRTRARLDALTRLACLAWLVQTVVQSYGDGTLLTWPTAILALCLIVVVGYTGYNAVAGWNAGDGDGDGAGEGSGGDGGGTPAR